MKNLAKKLTVLSKEEMTSIKGGMRWTNHRSVNVEDRRTLGGESLWAFKQRMESYTALQILNSTY